MNLLVVLVGAFVLALAPLMAVAEAVTLRNDVPRLDTDGEIIGAGDGCITYDPDTARYYLWGMRYEPCPEPDDKCYAGDHGIGPCQQWATVPVGECCGWRNMTIAVYSSSDLTSGSWRKEGLNVLPIMTESDSPFNSNHGAYFEACGAYNRRTGFWTLWYLDRGYTKGTAVSRSAGGPYEVVSWAADSEFSDSSCADYYLWLDLNGDMYMKHNGHQGEYAALLSDDWLTIVRRSPRFGEAQGYTEGGGIFRHDNHTYIMVSELRRMRNRDSVRHPTVRKVVDVYFELIRSTGVRFIYTSHTRGVQAGYGCCFCPLGSNGFLWRADDDANITGSYSLLGDVIPRFPNGTSVTHAQQFSITPVYTSSGIVPMFVGIRFGSAPDKIKTHDFQCVVILCNLLVMTLHRYSFILPHSCPRLIAPNQILVPTFI